MTIYEQLGEVLAINRRIRNLNAEIESLEQCLLPSGISYDGINVQTSPTDRMAALCAKIGDKNQERKQLVDKLPEAVERVTSLINLLGDNAYRQVLYYWYIGGYSVNEIKEKVYYTERSSVYKARRKAIKQLIQLDTHGHI